MNKLSVILAFVAVLGIGFTGCVSSGGNSVKPLEQMTELEYSKWKLYIQLGVKIGANRLVEEGVVTTEQLGIAAAIIDGLRDQPVAGAGKSLIVPALQKAGFNNDEVEFILLVAEQELMARGALDWLNPETNILELSPRAKEVLALIADALRTAGKVTENEQTQASKMNANFCRYATR
jgi:hypothetical protein